MAALDLGKGQHPLLKPEFLMVGHEVMDREHMAVISWMQAIQRDANAIREIVIKGGQPPAESMSKLKNRTIKFLLFAAHHFDSEIKIAIESQFPWIDIEIEAHKELGELWRKIPDMDFQAIWKNLNRLYEQTIAHGLRSDRALVDWERITQASGQPRSVAIRMLNELHPEGITSAPRGLTGVPIVWNELARSRHKPQLTLTNN